MSKTLKIYIALLILLFIGAFAIEVSKPKPVDWSPTYNETHKKPFGTYILYQELESLFNNSRIETLNVTPFEYFYDRYNYKDSSYTTRGSYAKIDNFADIDKVSNDELLNFANQGNTVFISSSYPPKYLLDTLHLKTKNDYSLNGQATLNFANNRLKSDSITIQKGLSNIYFSKIDTVHTTILGYQKFDSINHVNFIKVKHGNGQFLLHLQPSVFTNYHLLKKNNKKHAAAILSYLPNETIFFDSKNKKVQDLGNSYLRFILKQPALKWAWYLGLLSLLTFMIFNAKRKQRIVKVIKPLENTTVAFTKTIGNLYYETKDHNNLIDKKITYFLEYIRRVYYLDTQVLDEKFTKSLALKSGKDKDTTQKLIKTINYLRAKRQCSENDLLRLNKAIEEFHTA